jgi:3-phosphoglycerate kinase
MKIPRVDELEISGKRVLLRADVDVGETLEEGDDLKLLTTKKTLEFLNEKGGKVVIVGHRGRPKGKTVPELSLSPVSRRLEEILNVKIDFVEGTSWREGNIETLGSKTVFLENLRFDKREEEGSEEFAKQLSELGDIYINEAFSSSAKEQASIIKVPKFLPHAAGFHFVAEVENLMKVRDNPKRPVVVIISGVKEDKLQFVEDFKKIADKVLIAGRLPEYLPEDLEDEKLLVAKLIPDKEDITMHSIERFSKVIKGAGTVVVGGPVGKYEDEGHRQGTKMVFEVVAESSAFKVAGGGDTEQAIKLLNLEGKFDWISVGGGASLELVAKGTLPGIEALRD